MKAEKILVIIDKEKMCYRPVYPSDVALFNRQKDKSKIYVTLKDARNADHHKKAMALFKLGFENQDHYKTFDQYRYVMTMKAGYYERVVTVKGGELFIPKSLSFDSMGQLEFEEFFEKLLDVMKDELSVSPDEIQAELDGFM